jgi:hypothetical protein
MILSELIDKASIDPRIREQLTLLREETKRAFPKIDEETLDEIVTIVIKQTQDLEEKLADMNLAEAFLYAEKSNIESSIRITKILVDRGLLI